MNGDTIVVKTRDDGHRVKRIKRGKTPAEGSTTLGPSSTSEVSPNGFGHKQATPHPGFLNSKRETSASTAETDIEALAIQAAHATIADSTSPENTNSLINAASSSRDQSQRSTNPLKRRLSDLIFPDVDLSHLPLDPCGLRIWVAQQISHFQDVGLNASSENGNTKGNRLSSQSSHSRSSTIDDDEGSKDITGEGHSLRAGREHGVKSPLTNQKPNRNTDRGSRINRLSEDISGPHNSAGKHVSVQADSIKRRTKRQRVLASEAGRIPGSVLKPDICLSLFPLQDTKMDREVHSIGSLLLKTLVLTGSDKDPQSNAETANALRAALESEKLDSNSLVQALTVIASHPGIREGIKGLLEIGGDSEGFCSVSGDENEIQLEQAENAPTRRAPVSSQQSNEIVRVLNAVSALFNDMANTKEYVTPYGDPPPKSGNVNEYGKHKSNGNATSSNLQKAPSERVLDPSQIDALLALANGGSLTEDDDDKTIADPDEINGQPVDDEGKSGTDFDVTATFQRVVNEIAERNSGQDSNDRRGFPVSKSIADSYGSQSTKEKAATLLSLFTQAGVSINTIIPAAQSHATSQLYAHLSSRARSSTPSGGINPAHASAYGNTAQMNQRMLLKPGFSGQPNYMQTRPLQTLTSTSKSNARGAPPRPRDPEEQRKIMTYGFPPLPGSRLGAKKP